MLLLVLVLDLNNKILPEAREETAEEAAWDSRVFLKNICTLRSVNFSRGLCLIYLILKFL